MLATGKLPPDALPLELQGSSDCVLGLEYSGHVIGLNRTKVMGILPAKALATIVTTNPHFTWQVYVTSLNYCSYHSYVSVLFVVRFLHDKIVFRLILI